MVGVFMINTNLLRYAVVLLKVPCDFNNVFRRQKFRIRKYFGGGVSNYGYLLSLSTSVLWIIGWNNMKPSIGFLKAHILVNTFKDHDIHKDFYSFDLNL